MSKEKQHFMHVEIKEQPAAIRRVLTNEENKVLKIADEIAAREIERIYVTGCGDPYFAALAGKHSFEALCCLPTEWIQAMELSRYVARILDRKTMVLTMSISGRTPRTIEAASVARKKGAFVVAVTDDPNSPLTKTADKVIWTRTAPLETHTKSELSVPYVGYHHNVPQTKTYSATLAVVYLLSIYLAKSIKKVSNSKHQKLIKELKDIPQKIEETINLCEKPIQEIAKEYSVKNTFIIIGSGPNYATALYGAAKLLEFGILAIPQEMEEYCHQQFFITENETPVFIISPLGPSFDRTIEVLSGLNAIKAKPIIITNQEARKTELKPVKGFIQIAPSRVREVFTPIMYCVPFQLFAYHLAVIRGLDPNQFRGGIKTNKYFEGSYLAIRKSRIRTDY
jgi:glucosamine--fructose-6-phosphate aminotransferase (isomerizing)